MIVEHLLAPDKETESRFVVSNDWWRGSHRRRSNRALETPRELEITERGSLSNLRLVGCRGRHQAQGSSKFACSQQAQLPRRAERPRHVSGRPRSSRQRVRRVVTAVGEGCADSRLATKWLPSSIEVLRRGWWHRRR